MRQTIALLGGQMAIGAAAIFGRYALHGTDGLSACAWRMVLAALAVWMLLGRRPSVVVTPRQKWLLILAGCTLALHFAAWVQSLVWLPVALSSLLVSTSPIWNTLYETLILRRPPPLPFWLALLLATYGTALMLEVAPGALVEQSLFGGACAVAGAACMCVYVIIVARVHDADPGQIRRLGVGEVVKYTYTTCALVLAGLCTLARLPPPPLDDYQAWAGIGGMALVSQLFGHTLMNRAVQFFSAGTVTLTTLLKPLFAAVLAAWIFGERLSLRGYAGAGLVFVGIALAMHNAAKMARVASPSALGRGP